MQWTNVGAGSQIAALALLTGLGTASHAASSFAVYTGTSDTSASDVHISQPASDSDASFGHVVWDPKPFQDAPYYGFRICHTLAQNPHLALSGDFTHYKMYADTSRSVPVRGTWNGAPVQSNEQMNTRVRNLEISHGVNLTSLDLEYHFRPLDDRNARWLPYAGAGLIAYIPHAEGTVNDTSVSGDYQYGGWGYQLFAGTHYRLSRHFGVLLLAKFDSGRLDMELTPATRLRTNVRTLHVSIGVAWLP